MKKLTHRRLREVCHYDPETGIFTNRVRRGRVLAGEPTGGTHTVKGYGEIQIDNRRYATHRLAWFYVNRSWPKGEIDHINGVRNDNRIVNLRDVTTTVNRENIRGPTKRNGHGWLGVSLYKPTGRWTACICVNYRSKRLGYFATPAEASAAYIAAKRRLHKGYIG